MPAPNRSRTQDPNAPKYKYKPVRNRSRTQDSNAPKAKYRGGPGRGETTSQKKSRKERIEKEIKRIKEGGTTFFKGKKDSLTSLKGKLKKVNSEIKSSSSKKSNLKIAPAGFTLGHDYRGAAEAQKMARARKKSGKTIAQLEAERDKKMKTTLQERNASWRQARKEGKLKEWEAKNKPKKKRFRNMVDPSEY